MPRVVAITNQKGGVGKSTTAVNLGACLAQAGITTLVIDLDPQANTTSGLGIQRDRTAGTTYDVLLNGSRVESVIVSTDVPGLQVAPSTIHLAGAEVELAGADASEARLRSAMEGIQHQIVLLDCPPSLGLLTVNALTAATELLIPIQCEYYALEGLGQLMRSIELVRRHLNPGLEIGGVLLTMYDPRTNLSEQVAAEVRGYFGDKVFQTVIPRSVRLAEAPSHGQPITLYDPQSRGAQAYVALAQEVISRGRQPSTSF
ncbi:MAG: ParA family protein [Armatimonadota bacterium]|nr:ParA family protein [Armatimonadota bacterium]MDR7497425.1 ParA family protein [Armatimonadota bacterium]MDR7510988.1 ParA family protein [Armatimonadota bacterium]